MKNTTRLLFFLLLAAPFGKTMGQSLSAKQMAMAGIKAAALDNWSAGNPSSCAFGRSFSGYAGIENRFLGTDIQGFAVGGAYRFSKLGSFQIGINRLGIEHLFVQELSLGYARKLGSKVALGGNLLVFSRQADRYDKQQRISFNLGAQFPLSENIQAGLYLSNPIPDRRELPAYSFHSEIAAGISWKITKLTTSFEISKPQNTSYSIKTGLDYRPAKSISLLGGVIVSKQDLNASLGISYRLNQISLTMASRFHPKLPTGLSFGIRYAPLE